MGIRKKDIEAKLKEMEENVKVVKIKLPKGFEDFIKLGLVKDGIYKRIEFAIQDVIDICNIINSDLSLGIPSDEESVTDNLQSNKLISKNLAKKIKKMRGFRNMLVHRYGTIDDKLAFKILKNNLKDFELFKKEILKILRKY